MSYIELVYYKLAAKGIKTAKEFSKVSSGQNFVFQKYDRWFIVNTETIRTPQHTEGEE